MATGCGWSLFGFGKSADRNAALTALPIIANEDLVTGNGIAGTGTQMYIREDGVLFGVFSVAETAVSLAFRVKTTNQPDYIRDTIHSKIIGAATPTFLIGRTHYGIRKGESLVADEQNAADKVCALGCMIAEGGSNPNLSEGFPVGGLPPGTIMANFTATMTAISDSWSPVGQCVFSNYVLDATKTYKIVGMAAYGTSAMLARLRYYQGDDKNNAPGCAASTTAQLAQPIFGNLGSFQGLTGIGIQSVCQAADATLLGTLWLVEA
jgi:hypothetical protein